MKSSNPGRGKNLKNDDVPEVSEDDEELSQQNSNNQQPAGPTYRDMEEESDEDKVNNSISVIRKSKGKLGNRMHAVP